MNSSDLLSSCQKVFNKYGVSQLFLVRLSVNRNLITKSSLYTIEHIMTRNHQSFMNHLPLTWRMHSRLLQKEFCNGSVYDSKSDSVYRWPWQCVDDLDTCNSQAAFLLPRYNFDSRKLLGHSYLMKGNDKKKYHHTNKCISWIGGSGKEAR